VQGNFQLMEIHVYRKAEVSGQLFCVHDLHRSAAAFPLPVQARGI